MKKNLLLFFLALLLCASSAVAQTTYYWVGGTTGTWSSSSSWNTSLNGSGTSRSSALTTDILIFDGTNIGGSVPTTGIVTPSITSSYGVGQIKLQNAANVVLQRTSSSSSSGTSTLTINGDGTSTDDLTIDASSTLKIAAFSQTAAQSFSLVLGGTYTVTGTVNGNLYVNDAGVAKASITTTASSSLIFSNGAKCYINNTFASSYPFGSIVTPTITFQSGSTLIFLGGNSPFTGTSANIPLIFSTGSLFEIDGGALPTNMFKAHTFSNILVTNNATVTADGNPYYVDNLTINAGATFNLAATGTFPVGKDIVNNGTFGAVSGATSTNLVLCGYSPQTIGGSGTFNSIGALSIATDATVTLGTNLTIGSTSPSTSTITGKIDVQGYTVNSIGVTTAGNFQLRPAATAISLGTLTAGSNTVVLNSSYYSSSVNTANVTIGGLVTGAGIQPNTYIVATSSSASTFTISRPATLSTSVDAANITIKTNAATLATSNIGGIDGCITTTGTRTFGSGSNYIFNGATTTPFPTAVSPANLTINASVTLNNPVSLSGALIVASGKTLTTNNNLTLLSNANGTASIGNTTGFISGNVTVQRYIPAGNRAFRFLTPAVTTSNFIKANWQEGATSSTANPNPNYGTHITGNINDQMNGFDGTASGNPSLFQFNNTSQTWNSGVANTDATDLIVGNAYRILIRGNRSVDLTADPAPTSNTATTLRATGNVITGTVTMNSTGIGATANMPLLATNASEFSFIGNPYASSVDWALVNAASTDLTGYYYVWDPNLGSRGAYVSCYTDGTKSNPSSAVTTDIQSGQAIFIQNKSTFTTGPSLVFQESHKTTGIATVFKNQTTSSILTTQLYLTNNMSSSPQDALTVLFNSAFNNTVDDNDASKMTNLDENIAILRNSKLISIEQRALPVNSDIIQFKFWQLTQSNYTIKLSASNFDNNLTAFLQDTYLNSETAIDLTGTTFVNFSISNDAASYDPERFRVVFKVNNALPLTFVRVDANCVEEGVKVEWKTYNESDMKEYVLERSENGILFDAIITTLPKGDLQNTYNFLDNQKIADVVYYRIKAVDKNGKSQYSNVIKVKVTDKIADVSLYPIPLKGTDLKLELNHVLKGVYSIRVFNSVGQAVYSKTIEHVFDTTIYNLRFDNRLPVGLYSVQVKGMGIDFIKTIVSE